MAITPVILAGGKGERLWPVSTAAEPKPFAVKDAAGVSLFQQTLLRVTDRARFAAPLIVCNQAHRFLALDQLHAIGIADATLILEPEGRNTAAAITLAALKVGEGLMLVLPADHRITAPEILLQAVATAGAVARDRNIVTFAMAATAPETGYGYIQYGEAMADGVRRIARFIEKPDTAMAERFIASGDHGWNSGIFFFAAAAGLAEIKTQAPDVHAAGVMAYENRVLDHAFIRPDAIAFLACPAISFDHAVMEKTTHGAVLPVDMGWQDVGSWAAPGDGAADAAGNAVRGTVALHDVTDSYVDAEHAQVAAIGLTAMVVIARGHRVLIAPKARTQEVRELIAHLPGEPAAVTHRPWGRFRAIDRGEGYQVKQLCIRPGGTISLQTHDQRSEHWVVVKGTATVRRGAETFTLRANESTYIEARQEHRLENRGDTELIVIEVQTGGYLEEDDITRLENVYPV